MSNAALTRTKSNWTVLNKQLAQARTLLRQMREALVTHLGSPPREYIPKRPGEPDCTWADITKIRTDLGWQPKVSFAEGVKVMRENMAYWRDAPVWTASSIAISTRSAP